MVNYKTHVLLLSECVRPNEASWLFFMLAIPNISYNLLTQMCMIKYIMLHCKLIILIIFTPTSKYCNNQQLIDHALK